MKKLIPILLIVSISFLYCGKAFAATNTKSIDFEKNSSQHLDISDANQTGLDITGDYTVEFWMKRESTGAYQGIIGKRAASGGYYIIYWDSSNILKMLYSDGSVNTGKKTTVANTSTSWQHLAFVTDVSEKDVKVYVDGSSVTVADDGVQSATSIGDNSGNFAIGAMDNGSVSNYYDGLMDEIIMWNDVRTPTEISESYNSGNGKIYDGDEANMQGYWRLEDNLLDETSNDNDLTNYNSAVYSTDVPFEGAPAATRRILIIN